MKSYLIKTGMRPIEFSRKAKISRSYITKLMNNGCVPSEYYKGRIEAATNGKVGMEDWPQKGKEK